MPSQLTGSFDKVQRQNSFAKISLVHGFTQDDFMNRLQLAQSEMLRHQLQSDGGISQFGRQSAMRYGDDLLVIQDQRR